MSDSILIVEDDENLRLVLEDNLIEQGFEVFCAASCQSAKDAVAQHTINLILLDIMLPDGSGYDLCHTLRQQHFHGRILMLTARSLEDDIVQGLRGGADDYLTKPYRLRELLARIDILLQRESRLNTDTDTQRIGFANCNIDLDARSVTITNTHGVTSIDLTRKEFDLLVVLASEPGVVKTREELLNQVWGQRVVVDYRTIDNFISSLRKKLQWTPLSTFTLVSVRGIGYRLDSEHQHG